MHTTLRNWIVNILEERKPLVAMAIRQRAKFEGWLKFELAYRASQANDIKDVSVESGYEGQQIRGDICFSRDGKQYVVELKTPNTNWRMDGVEKKTRPITKNISSVVTDGRKLMSHPNGGIIAFVLFPVPVNDKRWIDYLDRISTELGIPLKEHEHTSQISVSLADDESANLVVCAFTVPHST